MKESIRPALWLLLLSAFAACNTLALVALDAYFASMLGGRQGADTLPIVYFVGGPLVGVMCGCATVLWAQRWPQGVLMALCSFCISVCTVCLIFGFRKLTPGDEAVYPMTFGLFFFLGFSVGVVCGAPFRVIEAIRPIRKWLPAVEMATCLLLIPIGSLRGPEAAPDIPPDARACRAEIYGYSPAGAVGDVIAARGSFVRLNDKVGAKFLLGCRPIIGGGRQQVQLLPIAQFDFQCSLAMPVIVLERPSPSNEPWTVAEVRKAIELDPSLLDVARTPQLVTGAQMLTVKAVKAPAIPLK